MLEVGMAKHDIAGALQVGMQVRGADGQMIGTITDVWPDVGVGESWGAVGSIPMHGAEAADAGEYAFSEAVPGEGESYFKLQPESGKALYVPFSSVTDVDGKTATVAVDADDVPGMQWDIMPDFLNVASAPDSGADSLKA
jgi:hypothetical protein